MRASWLALLFVAGCLQPSIVTCADGSICPVGDNCAPTGGCIDPAQRSPCDGLAEGDACVFGGAAGACASGICTPFRCGDGVKNGSEPCDGTDFGTLTCLDYGFTSPAGLVCRDDCSVDDQMCTGYCGDHTRDGIELCDGPDLDNKTCLDFGYYDAPGLACNPACNFDASACTGTCGDGIANGPEECDGAPPPGVCLDLGFDLGSLRCTATGCKTSSSACGRIGWRRAVASAGADAIWGVARRDLFAATVIGVLRWQGGSWNLMPGSPAAMRVIGGAAGDVWAADDAELYHWDGAAWTLATSLAQADGSQTRAIWWVGANDVWIVGTRIQHWNGTTLTTQVLPFNHYLLAMWGFAPDDVWAAGGPGELRHYNGTSWSSIAIGNETLDRMWGLGPSDLWASGFNGALFHYDGSTWSPIALPGNPTGDVAIWGSDAADILAVSGGSAFHWDGIRWLALPPLGFTPGAMWGAQGELVAAGGGGFEHRGVAEWDVSAISPSTSTLDDVWMSDDEDGWATSPNGMLHWDGVAWTPVALPDGSNPRHLFGFAPDDVWAGGGGVIEHWDGATWSASYGPDPSSIVRSLWGTSSSDLWAIDSGAFRHFDGTSWTVVAAPGGHTYDRISGTGPDDVWAVSQVFGLAHKGTGAWATASAPAGVFRAIWAGAPDDVWIGGNGGTMAHWNGTAWTMAATDTSSSIAALWGLAADDIFAVGDGGTVVHFDGVGWAPIVSPAPGSYLTAVHGGTHRLAITGFDSSGNTSISFFERHALWWH